MATRMQEIERELRTARLNLEDIEARMELLRNERRHLPTEPKVTGTLRFQGGFGQPSGALYHFAAIYANGRWYTTGSTCPKNGYTWRQLVEYMRDEVQADRFQVLDVAGFGSVDL